MSRARRRLLLAGGAVALFLIAARLASLVFADVTWYAAQGASALWWDKVVNGTVLLGATWLAGAAFVFINLFLVVRSVRHLVVSRQLADIEIEAAVPPRFLVAAAGVVSLAIGALLMLVQDSWVALALARTVPSFGVREPSLDLDVVVWLTRLPLERGWYSWAQATLAVVAVLVVLLYAVTRSLRWTPSGLQVATYVRRHLSGLGALLLLLLAWGYRLERLLLPVNLGPLGYFGGVEQRMLTLLLVLAVFTAACAVLVLWAGYVGQTRIAFGGVTAVILLALVVQQGGPALIRWSAAVDLDAAPAVWPYLGTQAAFTRRAFGAPAAATAPDAPGSGAAAGVLLGEGAARGAPSVAVWDAAAVAAAVERSGRRRAVVGRIGWVSDSAGLVAIAAARELAADSADTGDGWLIARVRAEPSAGELVPVAVTQALPRVLAFPGAVGDLVVADSGRRLAAPLLGRGWRRLGHALAEQKLELFFRPTLPPRARLLTRRDVRARIARLAPAFRAVSEPTTVIADDSLFWALPLYVSARAFPLGHAWTGAGDPVKYFHYAATAVVNAHTGRVRFVRAARPDIVARAWMARFPGTYEPPDRLSPALEAGLPIPEAGVRAQAFAAGISGRDGDRRQPLVVADGDVTDSLTTGTARLPYAVAPGQTALALALLGAADDRLAAVYAVSNHGRAALIAVDSGLARSWPQLLDSLHQRLARDADGSTGLTAVQGLPRLVATAEGPVLVQPSYVWQPDGVPSLARVAVASGDSIWTASTLRWPGAPTQVGEGTASLEGAAAVYARMREALRRADWAAFGAAFEALGRVLDVPPAR